MTSESHQRLRYVAADYVATNLAWLAFNAVRYHLLWTRNEGFGSLHDYLLSKVVLAGQIIFPLVMLGIYWMSGYYNNVFRKSRIDELLTTVTTALIGALLIFFAVLVNDMSDNRTLDYQLVGILFGLLFIMVYVPRWLITSATSKSIRQGTLGFDTLIIGTDEAAAVFAQRESVMRSMGFKVRGHVRIGDEDVHPSLATGLTVDLADLPDAVHEHHIQRLIVMPRSQGRGATLELVNNLFALELPIYVMPDARQLLLTPSRTQNIVGDPLIDISRSEMPQSTLNIKRVIDITASLAVLVVISPVLAILAAAVKLESPGPALYRQRRIGYHKRPFNIIKFRTMRTDAEENGPALSHGDNDPRITRIGRFLRKYRLDELPQFWNVVKGEMSIVGPRPEREFYIKQIMKQAPYYTLLHQVRPGITSWGMVRYGYATSVDQMVERLRYDILYLENISLAVDMKIILYTINTVIKGKGK